MPYNLFHRGTRVLILPEAWEISPPKALKWFLLTVITLGIYVPWAMSKVTNWFLNNTYMETGDTV
jgi:hypothetical protein